MGSSLSGSSAFKSAKIASGHARSPDNSRLVMKALTSKALTSRAKTLILVALARLTNLRTGAAMIG